MSYCINSMLPSVHLPRAPLCNVGSLTRKCSSMRLQGRQARGQLAVKAYKVTFKMPEGEEKEVEVDEETYILDAADDAGIDLPYSCRSGTCSSCAAKIVSGELDQSDQQFLDEAAIDAGYALICVSYAKSDMVLDTHKEDEVMG